MKTVEDLFGLNERVAVITGASAGLGVTFAKGLAAAGAKVVIAARRKELLLELESELISDGKEALAVECDVSKEEDVDRMVAATMDKFGRLDILVNNAGVTYQTPAEKELVEDFRNLIDINVTGSFLCAQRCGRVMLEAGNGSIINISSAMGLVGIGLIPQLGYNASKGAIVNLTRGLASQWARRGVRVNCIAPGWFPSDMTKGILADEKGLGFLKRNTPIGRHGELDELLGALILLASDASTFITGQTIAVDGGWTIV